MTLERRNLISQFLYIFGTKLTLTCHFPSQVTGSTRVDGVFGCCGNECQHLPQSLRGNEMLVIDGPVKIALHSSCQQNLFDTMNNEGCYFTLASNLSGLCFSPMGASCKPNYNVMVETILNCCQVNNEHIIHVAEIGCRLSLFGDDTILDPLFNGIVAMKAGGIKVELSQIDIAFVTKIAPDMLVQANFNKKNSTHSRSVLHGTKSVVFPLHNLPPIEMSPLKAKDVKGTLLVKQKKWANNKEKFFIDHTDDVGNENDVSDMGFLNLFQAKSTEKEVQHTIETHPSSVHSVKAYSTVAHSLMQHRTNLPLSLKGMFGVVHRSIDSIQTILKNLDTGFKNVSNIVKTSGIGFRIEVSIRPQFDDPIRENGHFNDFLLLIHLAIRDFCGHYRPKIYIMPLTPIHLQSTLLMRQVTSMVKFRHQSSFAHIYPDPSQHEWFRSHLSMLMISIGISPSYGTRYINGWLGNGNRFDPFKTAVSLVVIDDVEGETSKLIYKFIRILKNLHFSEKGVECLTQYVRKKPAIDPRICFRNLSLANKHLLAFHLWVNIIPKLSESSTPTRNANQIRGECSELELDSGALKEVEVYDSWWNEYEVHSDKDLDAIVSHSGSPEDPLSLVIHSLIKISILWNPGRIAFNQLLCRYIISSHDCQSLGLGGISDLLCYQVLLQCSQNKTKLTQSNFRYICGILCSSSIVGNSNIGIYQRMLCETYQFPWTEISSRLSRDETINKIRNDILNQVLDADLVSTVEETPTSTTYYRSLDQSRITIKKLASVVSTCKGRNLIPEFRDENLYEVLAMSVNTHHRTCFRQYLRSRIATRVNIGKNFLTSFGSTQSHFLGKHVFGEVEKLYNFKVDHRGKLSDFPLVIHYIPEIIVAVTCYIYQRNFIFYNMTKNVTLYFMYCSKNDCSIKYEIQGTEVFPHESSASISYSEDKTYQWNGAVKFRPPPKFVNFPSNLVDTHPFHGNCTKKLAMNILPHRCAGKLRPMIESIMKILSELDERYINNKFTDDPIGLLNLLTEMCTSSRAMKLFSKRAQKHCTELELPLPSLVSHLRKVSWTQLSHGILCPLTCLKYQNLIFAVFGMTEKKKWTKFYFYNTNTDEVDFVQMDKYNVFHDLGQVMYLHDGKSSSSYYKVSRTPLFMTEHKLHYYNSLSGCYSHLAPEQYTIAFTAMASQFEIMVVSQDVLQLSHLDHKPPKVTIVRTILTSEKKDTFQEWVQKGVEQPAIIFIFPPVSKGETWSTCIVHNPYQDVESALKNLKGVISTIDSSNGVDTKHCLKGVKANGWESCFLMILYAYLGSQMKTGIHLESVLTTLGLEENLIFKVHSWVSQILEGKLLQVPAWIDQLVDSSNNDHQMASKTNTRNQKGQNEVVKSRKRRFEPTITLQNRIEEQTNIAKLFYTDIISQQNSTTPLIPSTLRSVTGLVNPANDCYINVLIQLLFGIKCTRDFFLNIKFDKDKNLCSSENFVSYLKYGGSIGLNLGIVFARMNRGLPTNHFKQALVTLTDSYEDYDNDVQQDAHELLQRVFDSLDETFKKYHEENPIDKWFRTSEQGVILCSKCGFSSWNNSDKSFVIALCICGNTLESCLADHLKSIALEGFQGCHCSDLGSCTKSVVLTTGPIVTFVLKRFDYGLEKICQDVKFPMKGFTISNKDSYDLAAIISHVGQSMYNGHYVISMKIGNQWVRFDDQEVYALDLNNPKTMSELRSNAYILVYCQSDKFEHLVSNKEETYRLRHCTHNCFMNVGIQCLFGLTEVRTLFLDGVDGQQKWKTNSVSLALISLFQEMSKNPAVINVSNFKNILRQHTKLSTFAQSSDHDAGSFLVSLIEHIMCKELDTNHNAMISPMLHTIVDHEIHCSKCKKSEQQSEVLVNLIMSGKGKTLLQCLDEYFQKPTLIQDLNALCNCKATVRRRYYFRGGKVLILTFEETNPNVTFERNLSMSKYARKTDRSEYLFQLYGLISHSPCTDECHYIVYLKLHGRWYMFDCEKKHEKEEAEVMTISACCLIYHQQ